MIFIGSIMYGSYRQDEEKRRVRDLELKLRPARLRGLNHCVKCGFCCSVRTCIPSPDEVKEIASFLHITVEGAIAKYFGLDRLLNSFWITSTYFLKPVGSNIRDLAGKFIPAERTYNEGRCIFLDEENLCKIYAVRPKDARRRKCWDKQAGRDYHPVNNWKPNKLQTEFGIDGEKLNNRDEI